MTKFYDVAVVGAGPSGAFAAYILAKNGISTVLIDKEELPRYKVCGGGLVFRGRKLLPFELEPVLEREFKKVEIFVNGIKDRFSSERSEAIISMIMRDDFDNFIVKEAEKCGAEIMQRATIKSVEGEKITFSNSEIEVNAKIIVLADGALSPVSKMAGFSDSRILLPLLEFEVEVSPEDFERLSTMVRFDIGAAPYGYGWSFPKKNHLSIGVGTFKPKAKLKLKDYVEEYIKFLGIKKVISQSEHGFVVPLNPRSEIVKNNCFLIGDAAGFADPLVAEGISNAILSGKIVAESIIEGKLSIEKSKEIYLKNVQEELIPELEIGSKLAKFFYYNPKIRNIFLKKYGQNATEKLTEIFMGNASYPTNYIDTLKSRFRSAFSL